MPLPKEEERYSWSDYLAWPEGERYELVDGIAYAMSPAPRRRHQETSRAIFRQIDGRLAGKPCEAYFAPFDVKLSPDESDDAPTVVQPDITVTCDRTKLTEQGMTGPPGDDTRQLRTLQGANDNRLQNNTPGFPASVKVGAPAPFRGTGLCGGSVRRSRGERRTARESSSWRPPPRGAPPIPGARGTEANSTQRPSITSAVEADRGCGQSHTLLIETLVSQQGVSINQFAMYAFTKEIGKLETGQLFRNMRREIDKKAMFSRPTISDNDPMHRPTERRR